MNNLYIFNPTKTDQVSQFRGGGRIIQILKENLTVETPRRGVSTIKFVTNLSSVLSHPSSIFINPSFSPFQPPLTLKRIAEKQIQIVFDVIPLKYPNHFPTGIKGKFNLFLNKLALKNYDKIITISNHSKKDIVQYLKIPESKIEVVYPTLGKIFTSNVILNSFQDLNKMPKQVRIEQYNNITIPQNFCLYVGDVNWNKNLVNLARAIKIINVTCVFVGKAFESLKVKKLKSSTKKPSNLQTFKPSNFIHPWQKEFRDFLTEVGDDKRFIFLGYVPDSQLIKLYQQARLNVLTSRDEGFGFSFLEAASQSCPSVLSDIEVFHEIAGSSAAFVNPDDPHDIANKICEIYFNNDLRNKLGKMAKERSLFFSKDKFKRDFLKAIM